ncbi:DotU family type IV/VI secretion system protein [bacterium]|nr:DotU family type IV/VI secretion system protein [bacterium]
MAKESDEKKFDWSAANEDAATGPIARETAPAAAPAAPAAAPRQAAPRRAARLSEFTTPVFGCAAMLPREPGAPQPSYQQFRGEVLRTMKRLETEAPAAGIEREDAELASYALSLFIDEQVAESEWTSRALWATEPLHVVLQNDVAGGVNFFKKLEALGDRQAEVKQVFLVCLALGFRGKYAELDAAQQAAEIGAIRQRLVRSIQAAPSDAAPLFPDAYRPAPEVAPGKAPWPRWWLYAGFGTLALCLLIWLVLFFHAGGVSADAEKAVRPLVQQSSAAFLAGEGRA